MIAACIPHLHALPRSARRRVVVPLVLTLLPWSLPAYADIRVADDRGRTVVLAAPAQRIVSLAPHVTELLYAAGAGKQVVGVSAFSDFPAQATRLPQIGGAMGIDGERVAALRPDLVVAWASGNTTAAIEGLERLGLNVFVTEPRRLTDIPRLLRALGQLAGSAAVAAPAAADFEQALARLRATYARRATVRVFFQIEARPPMTLNRAHLVSDVLRLCGGENVFAALSALAPTVGIEDVLQRDPAVVLVSASIADADAVIAAWSRLPQLRAAQRGHVYAVPPDLVLRPTPRIVDGVRFVCDKLDAARR